MLPSRSFDELDTEQQAKQEDIISEQIRAFQASVSRLKERLRNCGGEMSVYAFLDEILPAPMKMALLEALKREGDLFMVLQNAVKFYLSVVYLGEVGGGGGRGRRRGGDEEEEIDVRRIEQEIARQIVQQTIQEMKQQQQQPQFDNPLQAVMAQWISNFVQQRLSSLMGMQVQPQQQPIQPAPQAQAQTPPPPPQQKPKRSVVNITEL
jgi:hypothetical protein